LLSPVYILLLVLGMSSSSFGQLYENTTEQIVRANNTIPEGSTSQTYTWIACDNDSLIVVECWGGGGGGARSQTFNSPTAGGGGGAYTRDTIVVTPGATYTVTVGAGGEGWQQGGLGAGTVDQTQRPGRPSFFATSGGVILVLAAGGSSSRTANTHNGNSSGGQVADCIFSTNGVAYAGGRGGVPASSRSGGGGGCAGSDGPGDDATGNIGGAGETFGGGKGADGVAVNNMGATGENWGGGGSGGHRAGGGNPEQPGGFGAHGAVRVTRFNDTLSLSDGSCLPIPLPIELLSFEGALNDRVIDLSWSTASEINNDYFIVKRSYDGIIWNVMAQVNGAGSHQGELNYALTDFDFDPAYSTVYYALSQVDYDGTTSQERKIAVSLAGLWNELSIFPNPTNEFLHVKFHAEKQNEQLTVLDLFGKEHTKAVEVGVFGQDNEFLLNVSQLSSGVYFIVHGSERMKFVKSEKAN
jgi:hypothetical protein